MPDKNDPPSADTSSSSEGFAQPLGPEPEVINEEKQSASVDGTASIGVQLVSLGCAMQWGPQAGLTNDEALSLHEDLARVLLKYDAPDVPCSEEVRLVLNLGGIAMRRVQADIGKRIEEQRTHPADAEAPPPPRSGFDDIASTGQEGVGEERSNPKDVLQSLGKSTRDILP